MRTTYSYFLYMDDHHELHFVTNEYTLRCLVSHTYVTMMADDITDEEDDGGNNKWLARGFNIATMKCVMDDWMNVQWTTTTSGCI